MFRTLVGRPVAVPVRDITGLTTARNFNGSVRAGATHLLVHTATGDVGCFVPDLDAWVAAIEGARPR